VTQNYAGDFDGCTDKLLIILVEQATSGAFTRFEAATPLPLGNQYPGMASNQRFAYLKMIAMIIKKKRRS
jgi:hypothetical protein